MQKPKIRTLRFGFGENLDLRIITGAFLQFCQAFFCILSAIHILLSLSPEIFMQFWLCVLGK